MNLWDILILAVIVLGVAAAVRHIRKSRKGGCPGCCSDCGQTCASGKK